MRLLSTILLLPLLSALFSTGSFALDSTRCATIGGTIINTLDKKTCPAGQKNAGSVEEMRCPCICCVDSKAPALPQPSPKKHTPALRKP